MKEFFKKYKVLFGFLGLWWVIIPLLLAIVGPKGSVFVWQIYYRSIVFWITILSIYCAYFLFVQFLLLGGKFKNAIIGVSVTLLILSFLYVPLLMLLNEQVLYTFKSPIDGQDIVVRESNLLNYQWDIYSKDNEFFYSPLGSVETVYGGSFDTFFGKVDWKENEFVLSHDENGSSVDEIFDYIEKTHTKEHLKEIVSE